ncbi:M1 family metallopeptidase [Flavilitoribacter nigricans]|uniref:Peptidase M1 membrane alanine aminopeptidase domain-containing protein n=1 Tax=Flavilitoribacter nigricans (strain ATCC 23147 / DSM 23189 / NBRC 102662 / NCIMB 1420 / SS-2) TaxID=1122177 RepID=A0A2D0NAE8_FLAN2|nr:M1 family metallopeptidase [Flavilitoribacter nigricans]PHN05465.1 hypothetical protein CRP01_15835 [Flavilitoribacter nigricans DSM 23189 = NBRC 102662]
MKYLFLLLVIFGSIRILPAQSSAYFQQETHYRIRVDLDDRRHTLRGALDLTYVNHAPEALPFIWFHLWPNAYRDQTTAFAEQQKRIAGTDFYYAKDSQLGAIDSLDFSVDGRPARLEFDPENPDIAKLWLPDPLAAGDSIRIRTPFWVKIPFSFSRLGHLGQSYQITQWYPKPAVYDADGWHPMPYLDQGEFYSEFGSFDVEITLPANYVVGATGNLETPSEKAFLQQRAAETRTYLDSLPVRPNEGYVFEEFLASSESRKTIRYTASRVHDFAWFADKRFRVQHDSVQLGNGRTVSTWTMFTKTEEQLWRKSIDYVNRSVQFYSDLLGDYPYPQATAVQSALSAGGGMEYPMITVIDLAGTSYSLDEVITHEVGHNWFYSILASNERDHAWMDEGLNSFYEQRYMQTYYPPARQMVIPDFLVDPSDMDLSELIYLLQARRQLDQAPDTPSDHLSDTNYWLGAYYKPAKTLWWLYHYWGEEKFDRALRDYYSSWKFRHPQPKDFRQSLEQFTDESLDWLFNGLLYSNTTFDYAIQNINRTDTAFIIEVRNRGAMPAPVPIYGLQAGEVTFFTWLEGFTGTKQIPIPLGEYDRFVLDYHHQTLDINRKNNQIKTEGAFKKLSTFRLAPIAKIENEHYTSLYVLPTLGWNHYDGLQLGMLLHNRTLPHKQFEFDLLPLYGFRTRALNGIGNADYRIYPRRGWFSEIELGVNYRTFHDRRDTFGQFRYQRWQPGISLNIRRSPASTYSHGLAYRLIGLTTESPDTETTGKRKDQSLIHELSYTGQNKREVNPFEFRFALEQQAYDDVFGNPQNYLKWSVEWQSHFHYAIDKSIRTRLFVGGFFQNTRRRAGAIFPGAFSLIDQAATDYRYDDFYFGRSEREGFLSQQLSQRDGGFRTPVSPAFSLGKSNNFILAVNFTADLPFGDQWPIRPYLDLGYFDNAMPTGNNATFADQFIWSGGLALEIMDGRFGLYFPLINSRNIQDRLLERGNFWNRIAFRFDIYGEKLRDTWENNW